MLTCMPTRPVASTSAHPANAAPWLESAPHHLDARRCLLSHTAHAPQKGSTQVSDTPLRAHSAASAHREQLSIPILLTR
jgi:hypothetical protein